MLNQNHEQQARDVIERDKTSLDITWIKDKSLTDLDNLPDPNVLARKLLRTYKQELIVLGI